MSCDRTLAEKNGELKQLYTSLNGQLTTEEKTFIRNRLRGLAAGEVCVCVCLCVHVSMDISLYNVCVCTSQRCGVANQQKTDIHI